MTVGNYCDGVPKKIEIIIHKQNIKRVTKYKYLGIIFYYNMKCDEHIEYIIKKKKKIVLLYYLIYG